MLRTPSSSWRRSAGMIAAAALPAAALAGPAVAATPDDPDAHWPVPEDRIGVVLFTTREQMAEDPQGTLNALSQCGIQNVEPSGSVGNFYRVTRSELAPHTAEACLNVTSSIVGYSHLT